jgi:hypothetical protein
VQSIVKSLKAKYGEPSLTMVASKSRYRARKFTPEDMIEWAKGPPLPHVEAHPAEKDASILGSRWASRRLSLPAGSTPMKMVASLSWRCCESAEISTLWGSQVTALAANKIFDSPAAIFWLGDPNVETVEGVVQSGCVSGCAPNEAVNFADIAELRGGA